jgi:hypothetical protein
MTIHMRPYAGAADLQRILELKRACSSSLFRSRALRNGLRGRRSREE